MIHSRVTAVLGPTNTGKTHYAIERMLAHRTGVIGLPLRLLAREVYDRIVAVRGPGVVALVTGEERIVPPRAAYWVCTVEAMPEGMGCDFLAIDEIQLCADAERGHVFTDRLLHARGLHETLFLGAATMRDAISAMVPEAAFVTRERFSELTYTGSKKISRMPGRSAIVGFSVENVYAIAELLRRTKGGAAVVMGALSPRTRNAQVDMYQNGDVDYLVATDAIGMGLNLDIKHVAFSALAKFDGRKMRHLFPEELAQIAGRAGRHTTSGTFGVTGEAPPLDDQVAEAITQHRFRPVAKLQWRNSNLQFGSVKRLIQTLEERTNDDWLTRVRESDDLGALKALAADELVAARATDGPSVRLLWDVCRIPDFRGISGGEHAALLTRIFTDLHQSGKVDESWLALQVARIDRPDGDIDMLSKRLAFIRTWTYVAQRKGWVRDESHWREATRAVEDRLSDALDVAAKVQRRLQHFIDRKIAAGFEPLLALKNDEQLEGAAKGFAYRLVEGFGIVPRGDVADEVKALDQDARGALRKHGIRFGQFTIFMPLLLKPAPTRLRLVLWSLQKGLGEFPQSPPPGLVTVPAEKDAVAGYYAMAGYRAAGERAIRIDMVERLADLLRDQDSRGGFEATADMLSITGMTLVQFADLMKGLGYKAEEGSREKVKPPKPEGEAKAETEGEGAPAEPEQEVFYTFTWGGRAVRQQQAPNVRRKGKPKGKPKQGGGHKPQKFSAKPKAEKKIDPDNPFAAALAGLIKD